MTFLCGFIQTWGAQVKRVSLHAPSVEIGVTNVEEGALYLFLEFCKSFWQKTDNILDYLLIL